MPTSPLTGLRARQRAGQTSTGARPPYSTGGGGGGLTAGGGTSGGVGGALPDISSYVSGDPNQLPPSGRSGQTIPQFVERSRQYYGQNQYIYSEGDEVRLFQGMGKERIADIQRKLAKAGLLNGPFQLGRWDTTTQAAMRSAMATANAWGVQYNTVIDELASAPRWTVDDEGNIISAGANADFQAPIRRQFVAEDYQRPTAAMLAQEVKRLISQRLNGREPSRQEIKELGQVLQSLHRDDYQRQVSQARREFMRSQDEQMAHALKSSGLSARELSEMGLQIPDVAGPKTTQATGPEAVAAAMAEHIDSEYRFEIDRYKDVDETTQGFNTFMQNMTAVDQLMGQ